MLTGCGALISGRIRQHGPITAAEFMDLALYAPGAGYYARADRRSGRAGDFVTSVDVGPLFGSLLASQFEALRTDPAARLDPDRVDLVEAGAGNGRLSADMLGAAESRHPGLYRAARLHLVERSAAARAAHLEVLGRHAARLASSGGELPAAIDGVLFANELLDAFPVHVVEMGVDGLLEVHVDLRDGKLVERLAAPSTPALQAYLDDAGAALRPGWRAEINLAAVEWVADAARRLRRGFLLLIDYGHEAAALYSGMRHWGTLTAFRGHHAGAPGEAASDGTPAWLADPGQQDLTSHVDLTSVRRSAERNGLETLLAADQTRFLLDLVEGSGLAAEMEGPGRLKDRLALKTLLLPGGLGSTHKVLLFRKR